MSSNTVLSKEKTVNTAVQWLQNVSIVGLQYLSYHCKNGRFYISNRQNPQRKFHLHDFTKKHTVCGHKRFRSGD